MRSSRRPPGKQAFDRVEHRGGVGPKRNGKRGAGKIAQGLGHGGAHRRDAQLCLRADRESSAEKRRGAGRKQWDKQGNRRAEEGEGLFRQGLGVLRVYYCNIRMDSRGIQ